MQRGDALVEIRLRWLLPPGTQKAQRGFEDLARLPRRADRVGHHRAALAKRLCGADR